MCEVPEEATPLIFSVATAGTGRTNTRMNRRATFTLLGTALVLLVCLMVFFLFERGPSPFLTTPVYAKPHTHSAGSPDVVPSPFSAAGKGVANGGSAGAADGTAKGAVGSAPAYYEPERDAAMQEIFAAMVTYSDEGVGKLSTFLGNSDPEVRRAAVEALKQIRTPVSAKVLRDAAKQAKTREDKSYLEEAAEFVGLPVYDPKKRRERKVEILIVD